MIKPPEIDLNLIVDIPNGRQSTTLKVWAILEASRQGDLSKVQELISAEPSLVFAQYNYAPPIHLAVREGHTELVKFLLEHGACDPNYRTYPFLDSLLTIAADRGHGEIQELLKEYYAEPAKQKFSGDNGGIQYLKSVDQIKFEEAVDSGDIDAVKRLIDRDPGLPGYPFYFWGEGILSMPAKDNNRPMVEFLLDHGALIPRISKWSRFYYFKHTDMAKLLLERGMDANQMNSHQATLLHHMAHEGDLQKAKLLVKHKANLNSIDDEYLSTALGLASRWGHLPMVEYLLECGASPTLSGAEWSSPLNWSVKRGHEKIQQVLRAAGG